MKPVGITYNIGNHSFLGGNQVLSVEKKTRYLKIFVQLKPSNLLCKAILTLQYNVAYANTSAPLNFKRMEKFVY